MTQEDKELLLKDLCARLPYGVRILYDSDKKFEGGLICQPSGLTKYDNRTCLQAFGVIDPMELDEIKPYLRPMKSMTEEEEREINYILQDVYDFSFKMDELLEDIRVQKTVPFSFLDWLNSHHFDYRGLIEKGLALEASEGMYNIIEK